MKQNRFLNRIRNTIERYQLLEKNDSVLVGFSGGKDSTALLFALFKLREEYNLKLLAFHLNHLLRGREAERDEKFCRQFSKRFNIPIVVRRRNVKAYAKRNKLSLEDAGHKLRFYYYQKIALEKNCAKIALAHTAQDNAETILLNLCRGSGLSGIAGLPPKRDNIIRPLIDLTNEEILEFLKENKLPYIIDSTNFSKKIPRNYIRLVVIPKLKRLNPSLEQTLRQVSQILQKEDEFLDNEVKKLPMDKIFSFKEDGLYLDKKRFQSYNLSIKRRVLKEMLPGLGFNEVDNLISLLEKPVGKKLKIAKECFAYREYDGLCIGKKKRVIEKSWLIEGEKEKAIPEIGLVLDVKKLNKGELPEVFSDKRVEFFDFDALSFPLFIRFRKPKDKVIIKNGSKKLKELLIDLKVPQRLRDNIPLLCDQKGILWVLGYYRAYRGFITEKSGKIIKVEIKNGKNTHS